MAPDQLQQRRTHNLLLISKLLNGRDNASPFTLIIDSLEQSGKPLVREYMKRAKAVNIRTIWVAFETLRPRPGVDVFIPAIREPLPKLQKRIAEAATEKSLLIIDSLNYLAEDPTMNLPMFLSSLISPNVNLVSVFHHDMPLTTPRESAHNPHPLALLKYLSTSVFTMHALSHILAGKSARDRSVAEPLFGIEEGLDGVIQGLGSNDKRGVVLELEYRRRSGRGIQEWFFLPSLTNSELPASGSGKPKEIAILLEDHPLYNPAGIKEDAAIAQDLDSTFNLGLTEKQRRDREGVVLPYFDAQRDGGGEGGRILYDMGAEDDFDEEEDEI